MAAMRGKSRHVERAVRYFTSCRFDNRARLPPSSTSSRVVSRRNGTIKIIVITCHNTWLNIRSVSLGCARRHFARWTDQTRDQSHEISRRHRDRYHFRFAFRWTDGRAGKEARERRTYAPEFARIIADSFIAETAKKISGSVPTSATKRLIRGREIPPLPLFPTIRARDSVAELASFPFIIDRSILATLRAEDVYPRRDRETRVMPSKVNYARKSPRDYIPR